MLWSYEKQDNCLAYASLLLHPDEFGGIVTSLTQVSQYMILCGGRQLWRTAQYPQVFGTATTHYGVGIVGGKFHDVVVAIEGAEETHLQLAGLAVASGLGLADTLFVGAVESLQVSTVDDFYLAVIAHRIFCFATYEVALEGMVVSGNLVPLSEVSVEVEGGDGVIVYLLCHSCGA